MAISHGYLTWNSRAGKQMFPFRSSASLDAATRGRVLRRHSILSGQSCVSIQRAKAGLERLSTLPALSPQI